MAILTERKAWRRERDPNATRRSSDLTPAEQAHVKAALRFLRVRLRTMPKLCAALHAHQTTVARGLRGNVTAGLALRAARLAGVPLETILAGEWPPPDVCPHCGRGG